MRRLAHDDRLEYLRVGETDLLTTSAAGTGRVVDAHLEDADATK
jgi:hypothetical protein